MRVRCLLEKDKGRGVGKGQMAAAHFCQLFDRKVSDDKRNDIEARKEKKRCV